MNIALYESHIVWEDKEKNIELFTENARHLTDYSDLDLICLPEMSFTGFSMNAKKTCDVDGETIDKMISIARDLNVNISFGWVEKGEDTFYNHYSIVDKEGVLLDYIKIHPFSFGGESAVFSGGEALSICSICGFNIGVQICYDLRFPETFRILSKKSDLIIVPANWPSKRVLHWDILLKSRAIEDQVFIAGINCIGNMDAQDYPGHSCVIKPEGDAVIGKIIDFDSGTKTHVFNIDNNVESCREKFPVRADIREELYRKLRRE
ncbi:MAG: carbon-nitrogen family hydrolase [Lachnospiraceae bacterium]|nr:carbon-nitrogen family hydrolase [Lachnospiraceae bacterium]